MTIPIKDDKKNFLLNDSIYPTFPSVLPMEIYFDVGSPIDIEFANKTSTIPALFFNPSNTANYLPQSILWQRYIDLKNHFESKYGKIPHLETAMQFSDPIRCHSFFEIEKQNFSSDARKDIEFLHEAFFNAHFYQQTKSSAAFSLNQHHVNYKNTIDKTVDHIKQIKKMGETGEKGFLIETDQQNKVSCIKGSDVDQLAHVTLLLTPPKKRIRIYLTAKNFKKEMELAEILRAQGREIILDRSKMHYSNFHFFKMVRNECVHQRYLAFLNVNHLITDAKKLFSSFEEKQLAVYLSNKITEEERRQCFASLSPNRKIDTCLKLSELDQVKGSQYLEGLLTNLDQLELSWLFEQFSMFNQNEGYPSYLAHLLGVMNYMQQSEGATQSSSRSEGISAFV